MKKLSAYQKLKQENQRLKRDLRTISVNPYSQEAFVIKKTYIIQDQLETAVFFGSATKADARKFTGILNQFT